jgi:hypothetical protein
MFSCSILLSLRSVGSHDLCSLDLMTLLLAGVFFAPFRLKHLCDTIHGHFSLLLRGDGEILSPYNILTIRFMWLKTFFGHLSSKHMSSTSGTVMTPIYSWVFHQRCNWWGAGSSYACVSTSSLYNGRDCFVSSFWYNDRINQISTHFTITIPSALREGNSANPTLHIFTDISQALS